MTRISKKGRRRAVSPRRHQKPSAKTGPKEDNLPTGYKLHENALQNDSIVFIGKIK